MSDGSKYLNRYQRRDTNEVRIGSVTIGGNNPIAVQSMTNTGTMDTDGCVDQIGRIRNAGCRIVRLTAPGRREGENLKNIMSELKAKGLSDVSIVADIHFTPDVALIAAEYVDKVRINPGNYNDPEGELFPALVDKCRKYGRSIRIGVNHGSLSSRMVEKWGDTPKGMVESALEFLEKCRELNFDQVVVSMKSSNVRVMVHAYRMLACEMDKRDMSYPIHLGVTEAGDGADGRIKSAVGIGTLLADGIGDTIRVSLTEPPENEIPAANSIVNYFAGRDKASAFMEISNPGIYTPFEYNRRESLTVGNIGADTPPCLYSELDTEALNGISDGRIAVLESITGNSPAEWRSVILNMSADGDKRPAIIKKTYNESDLTELQIKAACDFGPVFIDGLADGIWIENNVPSNTATDITPESIEETALSIFQAARIRMSKTEYIACPGCGRTLFDLQSTLAAVRERTFHLKGLKIGVMGCIVNGPGEMADADYGYVGAGKGLVTLYKNKEVVRRSIPQGNAIDALIELIKENNDWFEPNK